MNKGHYISLQHSDTKNSLTQWPTTNSLNQTALLANKKTISAATSAIFLSEKTLTYCLTLSRAFCARNHTLAMQPFKRIAAGVYLNIYQKKMK